MKRCRKITLLSEWHIWYAWHPVWIYGLVENGEYERCVHWLSWVERRNHSSATSSYWYPEYREIEG